MDKGGMPDAIPQLVLVASTCVAKLQDELSGYEEQLTLAREVELESIADVDLAEGACVITHQQMSAAFAELDTTGDSDLHHGDGRANYGTLLLEHHPEKGSDADSFRQCRATVDDFASQQHTLKTAKERLQAVQAFIVQAEAACLETTALVDSAKCA